MADALNQTGVGKPVSTRPLYYDLDGFRLSGAFNIDRYRSALAYKPQPDDIFIVTYPKCGTTWLQEICYLILNDGQAPANHVDRLINTPFFELLGDECVNKMRRPGAIKTHLPFNLLPYSPLAKYIYAIRNPKDCVVSFFYHTSQTYPGYNFSDGTFSEFFELFMAGETDFGSYFDHLRSGAQHANTHKDNIHLIYFEDVKSNGAEEILKLGRFLGAEYESKLRAGLLEKVMEQSSIKKMKEDFKDFGISTEDQKLPEGLRQLAVINKALSREEEAGDSAQTSKQGLIQFKDHVRKGNVNDWRIHLTPEQNARLEEKIFNEVEPDFPQIVRKWREHGVFDALPN